MRRNYIAQGYEKVNGTLLFAFLTVNKIFKIQKKIKARFLLKIIYW